MRPAANPFCPLRSCPPRETAGPAECRFIPDYRTGRHASDGRVPFQVFPGGPYYTA